MMRRAAGVIVVGLLVLGAARAQAQMPDTLPAEVSSATAAAEIAEQARLKAEAAKLDALAASEGRSGEAHEEVSFGAQIAKTFVVLGAVCLLAYLVLGHLLPRFMKMSPAGRRGMFGVESRGMIEVIDRLPLDPKRTVYVMKVGESHFLVGVSEQGMSLLSRLDADDIAQLSKADKTPSVLERLPGLFSGRAEKEG